MTFALSAKKLFSNGFLQGDETLSETSQVVRTSKNKAEPIIDHTPKTPFFSPLQIYILNNCEHCTFHLGKCRLEDSRGLTPMNLCINLYTHQMPADFGEILKLGKPPKEITEIQEPEPEFDGQENPAD